MTDRNKKCKTGWLKKTKTKGRGTERGYNRSRENKGQKDKNTVLPRGGHRMSREAGSPVLPCLPLSSLFLGCVVLEDSFPLWASVFPLGDGNISLNDPQGPGPPGKPIVSQPLPGGHRVRSF